MIEFTVGKYAPRKVQAAESETYRLLLEDNRSVPVKAADVRVGQILHGYGRVEQITAR